MNCFNFLLLPTFTKICDERAMREFDERSTKSNRLEHSHQNRIRQHKERKGEKKLKSKYYFMAKKSKMLINTEDD